jgi:ABC-2 type transport system ATP-binding protein
MDRVQTVAPDIAAGEGPSTVAVEGLLKRYAKASSNAVDGISFGVAEGEVFALLGPNGAGKTTTVGMLTTRIRPDAGTARIAGVDVLAEPVRARARLAVVPQRSNLDRSISIRNNLIFHAAYHGVARGEAAARADVLLEQFGLSERSSVKPDLFSGGQAQRVMIARALMHRPQVLFLDEPSTGLDPAARLFVWDRLRELRGEGVTLILTTHDMAEAAELSNRVAIMDHGRLLALDTPEMLIRSLPGGTTLELRASASVGAIEDGVLGVLGALGAIPDVERIERLDDEPPGRDGVQAPAGEQAGTAVDETSEVRLRLYVAGDAAKLLGPVASALDEHSMRLNAVELGVPTLEDVFIHLTGRKLR